MENDIRRWMRLVEGDSPSELEQEARMVQGDNQNEVASNFVWHFDPAFPISRINAPGADWMREEIPMMQAELGYDRYAEMFTRLIDEPIVLHLDEHGIGQIWDGYHRVGASEMQGHKTIPAIVGTRKL